MNYIYLSFLGVLNLDYVYMEFSQECENGGPNGI